MNKHTHAIGIALTLGVVSTAQAGIQISSSTNDYSNLINDYAALRAGGDTSRVHLNHLSGFSVNSQMSFGPGLSNPAFAENGSFTVDIAATSGNFIMDTVDNLNAQSVGNWFNAGQSPQPAGSTPVLAFGNHESATNASELVLTFNPGVTAFGFNYDDVGDVGAALIINWTDGTQTIISSAAFTADGYISIVSDAPGSTIDTITLTQSVGSNGFNYDDGFAFYGFTTAQVQVVPVPLAAWGTLGLLLPMGIARHAKRRRA